MFLSCIVGQMKEFIFVSIICYPLLVNILLIIIFQCFFLGKKSMLFLFIIMYVLFNGILPFLIGEHFLIDETEENDEHEFLALIIFILMCRIVDIFGFGLGKWFKAMWNPNQFK
ncbi:MAG: hypothetical protein DRR16_23360 [Candidatus Parabeggiatoa sp. nov. 3]|nr:MAG: hypothetical protein DRR00_26880 [Gammaproteobacteria bacterium]RKZ80765.1 MAG: hypothetical protein DRR16_23360 [Gammaproteobacteria bacterium]